MNGQGDPRLITIPASDVAFQKQAQAMFSRVSPTDPAELEARLRRLFPRAVVRRREISGEPAWYVYRDGGWRSELHGPWWQGPGLGRVVMDRHGWLLEANPTALGLLGISGKEMARRHFSDFVVPGTLDDATALFAIVQEGHDLNATVLLRPVSGDVLAVDLHAESEGTALVGYLRLAEDVVTSAGAGVVDRAAIECVPVSDAAFRGYVERTIGAMPDPTPDGLALRLRRLYPHAQVAADAMGWTAYRDRTVDRSSPTDEWWVDRRWARVRYDAQALIIEANGAAEALLGQPLVGHHWQEFVTPGSTEQVSAMLDILAKAGGAASRFRMPRADGSLLEFDSYTQVAGDGFVTTMRPCDP